MGGENEQKGGLGFRAMVVHTAHMPLGPTKLGSLTVKIFQLDSWLEYSGKLVARYTQQARDLLEGQMGRLRECWLSRNGPKSSKDVDVFANQDTSNAQDRDNYQNNTANQNDIVDSDDEFNCE